ncbi:MAG: M20/M25/M40 family metallo-hydrolase [Nitriliruptoraceae bacterium]
MTTPPRDVVDAVHAAMPTIRTQLEDLVRIPSISAQPEHRDDVRASADATARLLADAGAHAIELLEVDDAPPYVFATWQVDDTLPTVLLYAHHDVQPTATADRWTSPPFEPAERDGRLFGRGAADDKAGVMAHVAALSAWQRVRGGPPCNVRVIVEGEEEVGSPNLTRFLEVHGERLRADVIVLTDLANWKVGWPGLTRSLRGMAEVTVTVSALEQPVHSGMWGGPVPDALTGMVRLLASLHDDRGELAVEGFADDVAEVTDEDRARLDVLAEDPDEIRRDTRMLDGVAFVGDDTRGLLERMWLHPTITPTGMDVPPVAEASNTLLARVTARLSCRLAPGQDPDRALATLEDHLRAHVPWGLHLDVVHGHRNAAWSTPAGGPAWDAAVEAMTAAYGRAPAILGCGGSIPFVEPFSDAFGGAPCLLVGVEDPASNAHGEDESLHLDDFARACVTEVLLLDELARRLPG